MRENRVICYISYLEFRAILLRCKGVVCVSTHALDHIYHAQRGIYTEDALKKLLLQKPQSIGLQDNNRYFCTYLQKDCLIRIIVEDKKEYLEIITFIRLNHVSKTRGKG